MYLKRLRELRKDNNLTQNDLAKVLYQNNKVIIDMKKDYKL